MPVFHSEKLRRSGFSLDSSGIAGFFGGEEAFAAMNSIHLIPSRRWLGWYNSPGSYFVAKKYGILPNSKFWDGLFPGAPTSPAELLEMDSKQGPRYTGVLSGTQLPTTGHLSYLLSRYCKSAKLTKPLKMPVKEGRHREIYVTIVKFRDIPSSWPDDNHVPLDHFKPLSLRGKCIIISTTLFSFMATFLSALFGDWYSFSMILFGAFVNGFTSLVLGNGKLCLELTNPSSGSPLGNGFFFDGKNIIIAEGGERVISTLLHQRYSLAYKNDPNYHKIGICSIMLLAQFLLQLILIPQGILVGQILFVSTLAVSWLCNGYLASFDREELQTNLLFKSLGVPEGPELNKFQVDKWSTAVAFSMFYFNFKGSDPEGIINELMPNKTPAWNLWKQCICAATRYDRRPGTFIQDKKKMIASNAVTGGSVPQDVVTVQQVAEQDEADQQAAEQDKAVQQDKASQQPAQKDEVDQEADKLTIIFRGLPSQQDRGFVRQFLNEADRQFNEAKNFNLVPSEKYVSSTEPDCSAPGWITFSGSDAV